MNERKGSNSELTKALRELQGASSQLTEELSSRARARKEETLRTSIRERQAARADRHEESEELARLPYDHANAVNIVPKYCPDYPPRLLKRYLPGLPVSLDRLSAERTVVERLLGWKLSAPDPCVLTNPVILSAPRTLFLDKATPLPERASAHRPPLCPCTWKLRRERA